MNNLAITPQETLSEAVDAVTPVEFAAKEYSYHARIVADSRVHVAIGAAPTADADSFAIMEERSEVLAVPKGSKVSVLGSEVGKVWISEIKYSA